MKSIERILDYLIPQRTFQKQYEWLQERWRRHVEEGWLPTLWDEGATDEEKAEAILKYARGEYQERRT